MIRILEICWLNCVIVMPEHLKLPYSESFLGLSCLALSVPTSSRYTVEKGLSHYLLIQNLLTRD